MFILRLGYIFLLLNDATDFEGRALDVRIISIAPEVSLETAVFLLAALITAAVMQPFIALAFDGAVGILVGSVVHSRNVGILNHCHPDDFADRDDDWGIIFRRSNYRSERHHP